MSKEWAKKEFRCVYSRLRARRIHVHKLIQHYVNCIDSTK
jgi:hypothetical protein